MTSLPEFIGEYRVARALGEGAMGTLYLAQHPRLDIPVAIKVFKEDSAPTKQEKAELRARFGQEARVIARLRDMHIVGIYDVQERHDPPFIAMEYIEGETLKEMIGRRAPLSLTQKLVMIEGICRGLRVAHEHRIVHRDIKPANLMVDPRGNVKVLDFGIARLGDSTRTQAGTFVGTYQYMSPEQMAPDRRIDARSDIFAVGSVFYELLTYRKAFPGKSPIELVQRIRETEPEPVATYIPGIDPGIVRILELALKKHVAERYQDIGTMANDIAAVRKRVESEDEESAVVVISKTVVISQHRNVSALLANARAALEADQLDAARAAVNEVLHIDPASTEAQGLLANIGERAARHESQEYLAEAVRELELDALSRAAEFVQRSLELAPENTEAHRIAADIQARQKVRDAAVAASTVKTGGLEQQLTERAEQHSRQARELLASARQRFDRGERLRAISSLEGFSPPHALVTAAIAQWRAEAEAIEDRSRRDADAAAVAQTTQFLEPNIPPAVSDAAPEPAPPIVDAAPEPQAPPETALLQPQMTREERVPDERRAREVVASATKPRSTTGRVVASMVAFLLFGAVSQRVVAFLFTFDVGASEEVRYYVFAAGCAMFFGGLWALVLSARIGLERRYAFALGASWIAGWTIMDHSGFAPFAGVSGAAFIVLLIGMRSKR